MKKTEPKKAMKSASKPLVKPVAKAAPAKKAVKPAEKKAAAPAKKAASVKVPAKKAVAPAKKAVVVKAPAKKAVAAVKAPAKKAAAPVKAPAKKAVASAKKAVVVKAPAKKAAPVKAPAKKAVAPAKKAVAPAKKAAAVKAPAKKAAAVKAPAKKAEVRMPAPVAPRAPLKAVKSGSASSAKKKADKNKDVQASHHGRIVTKAEVEALRIHAEASGHVINKSHLSPKMKKHYRELLLTMRASYQDQLNIHRDDALTNRKSGPGAGMATHMADLGSDNFQHDFELGLLSDEGTVIEMIDEALTRLDENEYGICMECGKEIGAARLEIKPFARFCLACKSRKEASEKSDRRYR